MAQVSAAETSGGGRIGVLLINLGTPEDHSYWPMRRYLKEFLSDRRVIETNRLVWWVILNGIILTRRPKRSGEAYRKIWNLERNESPLRTITRAQAGALADIYSGSHKVTVDWAMRYGEPRIGERLKALKQTGHDRILLVPLYPQYSATTTATALDQAYDALSDMRWQPAIRTLPPYFDDPSYIAALARSIRDHEERLGWSPERLLVSFHGLPQTYVEKGDPYDRQCMETARLLKGAMGMADEQMTVAFQSRFGKAEWLKPYADITVKELARSGCRKLLVICPGFSADCVETLEEVGMGLRDLFIENGGEAFSTVPCLNDTKPSIEMLSSLIRRELKGWM
jgi:protoporphyrin/coproporphyrin ferrochelatase